MARQPTLWERTRAGGRIGFDKIYGLVDKLGAPVNKLTNKLGSEAFWPTTLDKEADKAARILRSFCKDGFYEEEERPTLEGPKVKQKVLASIPAEVIRNAKGLAIFTTMRSGLWMSGAGGCGVITARLPDGSWSPPSGIMLHTAGLGFLVGIDIYDCILVINTDKAMDAFARVRCTVGGEVSAVAGPVGVGGMMETELHKRQAPIFTYLKSRGFYAGVQIDGTVMLERDEENERFYNQKLSAREILSGKVRHPPYELERFFATIKAAEGQNVDQSLVPSEPPPGDYEIQADGHTFGIPDKDDPDPYGVLQLEKEGMVIREAGTNKRASWEQFTFAPSVTSPIYDTFDRRSKDRDSRSIHTSRRSSWMTGTTQANGESSTRERGKTQSSMADMSTQTDDLPPPPSPSRNSVRSSVMSSHRDMDNIPEHTVAPSSPSRPPFAQVPQRASQRSSLSHSRTPPQQVSSEEVPQMDRNAITLEDRESDEDDVDDAEDDHEDSAIIEEAPVVHSVQKAPAPQVIKARMVSVPKRGPPPRLPPRNPNRSSGPIVIDAERADDGTDTASATTPTTPDYHAASLPTSPVSASKTPRAAGSHNTHATDETEEVPDESPEDERRDPWAKVMAKHSNNSGDSVDVPGAFHSMPTTPDEREVQPRASHEEDDFS